MTLITTISLVLFAAAVSAQPPSAAQRGDWPMLGGSPDRNMVSGETGISAKWDLEKKENVKWVGKLGSPTYGAPVIAGGRIFIGTNNKAKLREDIIGDKGVMACLDESTGRFLWQATHDKLPSGQVNDWPEQGIPSAPWVDGERLYYVSNRCELVCADVEGFLDGENDGPFKEERHKTKHDADFVWVLDMFKELNVFPHNLATCSPVGVGDVVFVTTSNGVDERHDKPPHPDAPSLIAVNKQTGKVLWQRNDPGENILHGQWSSPAYGVVAGKPMVIFGAGDGWCYAHDAKTGDVIWKFDLNPKESKWITGGRGDRNSIVGTPVIDADRVFLAVGQDPDNGDGVGHLYCIDATKTGDVTETGRVWHFGGEDFKRSISTVAVADGLVYAADLAGFFHCLDAKTGKQHWVHDTFAAIWGSPLVVDGKVMIGTQDGEVLVFAHGEKKKLLATADVQSAVYSTPVAANGTLYVATSRSLIAIAGPSAAGKRADASTSASEAGDWPMFRGNPQLTGVATSDLPSNPKLLWKCRAGESIGASAAIVGDEAYVGSLDGILSAVDLASGQPKWQYRTRWAADEGEGSTATAPADGDVEEPAPGIQSSPCVAAGVVYFGDEDGTFHAVDAASGRLKWEFRTEGEIISSPNHIEGRVLFGSYDGHLYCLSAAEGRLLWKFGTEDPVHGSPAVADGKVAIAGCDGRLRVIRLDDGKQASAVDAGDRSAASPAIAHSMIYIGTLGSRVLGIDLMTGRIVWTYEDPDREFPFHASAAVTEQCVLVGGRDKILHALDPKTGKARWTFKAKARIDSSPAIVGDRVFFGSSDGNLYGLDMKTGKELWHFEAGAPITASPAVGRGHMVVGADDGMLYCFGDKPGHTANTPTR
ncbi:MAG: PQQ-binding-like beta-propeller repeat protein [Planctomycetota bacterium]